MASSLFVVDYIVQVSTEVWHLSRQIQDGIFTFLLNNFEFEAKQFTRDPYELVTENLHSVEISLFYTYLIMKRLRTLV